jgi:hypothetical protein
MKKSIFYLSIIFLALIAVIVGCSSTSKTATDQKAVELRPSMDLKAGEEVYACNCGPECPCNTLSRNAGKCTCGVDLVKSTVKSVGDGTAVLIVSGEERTFKTIGKYACACGPQCPCNTISQNPGKCTCGVEMKEVKSNI